MNLNLSFLPLPLYIIVVLSVVIVALINLKNGNWKVSKIYAQGLIIGSIGALSAVFYKITQQMGILSKYEGVFALIAGICGILGLILINIGIYNDAKDDPQRKKLEILRMSAMIIIVVAGGLLVAYFYHLSRY